ncbi:MAG: HIT family protein [Sedimentisphaerales bacterium]|nr:HIT family protein [Sedimentisphaerales bacterium]
MDTSGCIFCRIANGQIGAAKVFEDKDVVAFLDIAPVSDGHCLVVPKGHYPTLDQCPPEALARIGQVAVAVARAAIAVTGADGYNLLCNNGRAAGQVIAHAHVHVIPRRLNDGLFDKWPSYQYPAGLIEQLAGKIRQKVKDDLD